MITQNLFEIVGRCPVIQIVSYTRVQGLYDSSVTGPSTQLRDMTLEDFVTSGGSGFDMAQKVENCNIKL
eukprot:1195419-Prorocentrum_minimum.AAC.3